jgi:DNA helicase II / ATP-dependent DNA helicase PcrA
MKKNEIKVDGKYTAKVSGKLTTVQVTAIRNRRGLKRDTTVYDVVNLSTGRKTTFSSAAKFRKAVSDQRVKAAEVLFKKEAAEVRCNQKRVAKIKLTPGVGTPNSTTLPMSEWIGNPPKSKEASKQPSDPTEPATETATTTTVPTTDPEEAMKARLSKKGILTIPGADHPLPPIRLNEEMPPMVNTGSFKLDSDGSLTPDKCPSHASGRLGHVVASDGTCIYCDNRIQPLNPVSPTPVASGLSQSLAMRARPQAIDKAPHVIVEARAGTGKTTTLIEGLKRVKGLPVSISPSPQQAAVWEAMEQSKGAQSVCFAAFNKSIATELQRRVPAGCEAMTMHSMGFKAVQKAFGRVNVSSYRVQDIISEILETDIRELRRRKPEVLKAIESLVGLCKMNLVGSQEGTEEEWLWDDSLTDLARYYDIDLNGQSSEVFRLVPRVLNRCKDVGRDSCVDFSDMIWIPVALNLNVYRYDLLLVDEVQDLSRVQQSLARKAGERLIMVGDSQQAIYGFAGADCLSMDRLQRELAETTRGCICLPLTVTRRCGKAIVQEAQKIVPDFSAHESNCTGKVGQMKLKPTQDPDCYRLSVQDGDMVLCRVNAPLVSECFAFLRAGRKATIQGRDVGAGLISTVKKVLHVKDASELAFKSTADLISGLSDWLHHETQSENAKRNPSESRLINLQDRYDCLLCFCEGATTALGVTEKIERIFTDDKESPFGIRLSSVHKAKGLEAQRVFILLPKGAGMPHPMAKSAWEQEQEMNLKYVAITRAIETLVWVTEKE